jgi:hypothetical protein
MLFLWFLFIYLFIAICDVACEVSSWQKREGVKDIEISAGCSLLLLFFRERLFSSSVITTASITGRSVSPVIYAARNSC